MTMPGEKPLTVIGRTNENRRASKPLMEKRRRARINHSLAELKTLILDAVKKEQQNTRHSKLEKADILELTVKHLQTLHRQQSMVQAGNNKFTAGFKECAKEVSRFVDKTDDMEPQLRSRLLNHLSRCLVNHQPSNTKNTTSAVIHPETELLQQPEMSRSPASASSYSGDGSYYLERADSAGPDFAGSSPTRPSSSSYQFHNSPSHETASRASTPGSMRGYLLGVNPAMAPDPYDFNTYPPMESEYLERPASPLNLVVGPSKDNQLRDNQPSDPTEPQPKYCPNPDDDSVWRPW